MEKQIDPDDIILDLKLIYNKIKENPELNNFFQQSK